MRPKLTILLMKKMKYKMQLIPQQKMVHKVKGTVRPPTMMMGATRLLAIRAMH
jgi:hypothetical protein